jgi:hypothetical protein
VYTTHERAKKRAKELKRLFDDSGIRYPLYKSQRAIAKAGGYSDWHEMEIALIDAAPALDPALFRRRLLAALPSPCHAPVKAWLDGELTDASTTGLPPRYFRDVYPYLSAASVLHRSRTPLLRPGSGLGQKLRETLVVGLLLNIHGGSRPWPRLDPETLAMVFEGDLRSLFREDVDHARFAVEFQRLQDEGVLVWTDDVLEVMPPDVDELMAWVLEHPAGLAQHWEEDGDNPHLLADTLRDALAAIGIDNARRVADAIAQQGSDAYITPSGAVLTLLTKLAEQGDIVTFARAYALFAKVHRTNSRFVRENVPAKIMSGYFGGRLRLDMRKTVAWTEQTPGWATELKAALSDPALFVSTVERMASQVREAA